ncbi:MAG: ABC transporter ATP-binding protein, partial [Erysipelotrichaceae bacterium]
ILHDINLKIYPGETLAIMGTTGSGKTTLLNLICRFYDADEGEILIDGINIKDYDLFNLRKRISLVLQKSELFTQSIKENIAWGNISADNEQIIEAARTAQAHDFIMSFPDGYETTVEEKGASLSGGQKQRIAIARSLLKPAEIRIFDDATSALDLNTERKLFDALNKHDESATRIIVAQRISSVINANHIAVIDNGTIVGYGTHDKLMKNCQIYKDIYNSQMSKEENDDF